MLINEVARIAGMSKDGIRHYEKLGLISSSPKPAGSRIYREYDASVLETIDKIHQAQRLGLSLAEIRPYLDNYRSVEPTLSETVDFLEARLMAIRGRIAELREVERYIETKIRQYRPILEQSQVIAPVTMTEDDLRAEGRASQPPFDKSSANKEAVSALTP